MPLPHSIDLLLREIVFRLYCRHEQGTQPNILLYCTRRGGSGWWLNVVASHPGMRYVGRPLLSIQHSRWRRRMPDLAIAAGYNAPYDFHQPIHFEGEDDRHFQKLARDIIQARIPIHPTLAIRAPFFQRKTNRVIFQITGGVAMIEWFDEWADVMTMVLFRNPISTALSLLDASRRRGIVRPHECNDFLYHTWFTETQLTGEQVDFANRVLDEDSTLAHHVLDWSLKMLIPYRAVVSGKHPDWAVLTYEQSVTMPDLLLEYISEKLDLPDIEAMRRQMRRPSRTVSPDTTDKVNDPEYLLGRWRKEISRSEEKDLIDIPRKFGIELYEPGRNLPLQHMLIES